MSIHLRFDYDESVFRFIFRIDGAPVVDRRADAVQGHQHAVVLRDAGDASVTIFNSFPNSVWERTFRETPFRVSASRDTGRRETEFPGLSSQTEFGNQGTNRHTIYLRIFPCLISCKLRWGSPLSIWRRPPTTPTGSCSCAIAASRSCSSKRRRPPAARIPPSPSCKPPTTPAPAARPSTSPAADRGPRPTPT